MKTQKVLGEIVKSVTQAMDMIQQIATASEQQSSTAEEISKSVDAISTVTKQSATGAEQMATASEQLNRQTEELRNLIAQFKLSENGSVAGAAIQKIPVMAIHKDGSKKTVFNTSVQLKEIVKPKETLLS